MKKLLQSLDLSQFYIYQLLYCWKVPRLSQVIQSLLLYPHNNLYHIDCFYASSFNGLWYCLRENCTSDHGSAAAHPVSNTASSSSTWVPQKVHSPSLLQIYNAAPLYCISILPHQHHSVQSIRLTQSKACSQASDLA